MRTIEDVRKDYEDGKYNYIDKEVPKKLPEGYIFDEELSVRQNREMVQANNELRSQIIRENNAEQGKLIAKLRNEIKKIIARDYGFTMKQANFIEQRCYEKYHAYFGDYFCHVEEDAGDFYEFWILE